MKRRRAAIRARVGGLLLAALAALVPLLAVYMPRNVDAAAVQTRFDWAVHYLLTRHGYAHALGVALSHVWLPREAKDLLNGIVAVKAHNDTGHRSYLLGQVSLNGWWYFYLVTLAVKTPLPLLVGGSARACVARAHRLARTRRLGAGSGRAGARHPRRSRAPSAASTSACATCSSSTRFWHSAAPTYLAHLALLAALRDRRAQAGGTGGAAPARAVAAEHALARLSGLPAVLQRGGRTPASACSWIRISTGDRTSSAWKSARRRWALRSCS